MLIIHIKIKDNPKVVGTKVICTYMTRETSNIIFQIVRRGDAGYT